MPVLAADPADTQAGLRKDFIVASLCRAAKRSGALLAQVTED